MTTFEGKVVSKEKYFDLIGYKPHERQWLFHKSTARFKIPVCGRRFGKALEVNTLIPTPYGMRRMEDLDVGDQVFSEDGMICNVTGTTPIMLLDAYKIEFDDGVHIVANDLHEWLTYDKRARKTRDVHAAKHESDKRRRVVPPEIRTTRQILETLNYGAEPNHAIQLSQPVQFPKQNLPIDPYLLGVWLGDGTTRDGTLCIAEIDEWIVEKIKSRGYEIYKESDRQGASIWRVVGLRAQLIENFLIGNKRVPVQYLYGSVDQRSELLYGLMDTDGSVANNHVDFDNTNRNLADVVHYLITSLGGKVSRSQRIGKINGIDKKLCYRVHTGSLVNVFSLPRKLHLQRGLPRHKHYYRFIKNIEYIGKKDVKCIEVDSPSSLYLATSSFIPTHNSLMGAREVEPLLLVPRKRVWIVGPTYDLAEKEFRVIWEDMIVKLGLGREKAVKKAYSKRTGEMFIEFPWGSRVEVRSADRAESLVGEKLDYVIMSEAAKHHAQTWERFIRPALADNRGYAIFPTTPEGQNWVYDLWQIGRNPIWPDYESWRFPSWENPFIYPAGRDDPEIQLQEKTMPHEWFQQEIAADFTTFMGKIFSEWDDIVHVKECKFNPHWPNYIAWDFGYNNPMAAIEFQVDPLDRIHIWREHYKQGVTIEGFIGELKSRIQPSGYVVTLMFGDAASPAAVAEICQKMGPCIANPKSKDDWREGIDLVTGFLKVREVSSDEFGTPQYEPWLYVDHSCRNLIREFNNYRADTNRTSKPRNAKELGYKNDDHGLDALRYGLMHIFKLGVTMRLSDIYSPMDMQDIPETGYFVSDRMSF